MKFSFNFLNFDSSRLTGSTFPLFLCKQLYKSSAVNVKNSMFLTSFCGWGFVKQFILDGLSIVEACILDKIDHYRWDGDKVRSSSCNDPCLFVFFRSTGLRYLWKFVGSAGVICSKTKGQTRTKKTFSVLGSRFDEQTNFGVMLYLRKSK